jgi:hypothetical protein
MMTVQASTLGLTIAERKSRPDWTAKASSVDLSPFDLQQSKKPGSNAN